MRKSGENLQVETEIIIKKIREKNELLNNIFNQKQLDLRTQLSISIAVGIVGKLIDEINNKNSNFIDKIKPLTLFSSAGAPVPSDKSRI